MRVVVSALLLLVGAVRAAAQLCAGNSNFSLSHFHSAVDVDIDKLAHRYTAEFRYRYRHFFGGLEYGLKSWEITSLNGDRKSTRLNSSHTVISYAVFCLKKKK